MKINNQELDPVNNETLILLEQKAIKAMINPHFIFNVINAIQHFINCSNKEIANIHLVNLAKLIRLHDNFSAKKSILLKEEIDYLTLYITLEKLRFGEEVITFEIIVNPNIDPSAITIPAMMIQPFLNNAIWHGILPTRKNGNLRLYIDRATDTMLSINVEDNGVGIDKSFITDNLLENLGLVDSQCISVQRLKLLQESTTEKLYLKYQYLQPENISKGTIAEFLLPASFN